MYKWGNLNAWAFTPLSLHLQWPLKLLMEDLAMHEEGCNSRRFDTLSKVLCDSLPEPFCLLFRNMIIFCAMCSACLLFQQSKIQSKYLVELPCQYFCGVPALLLHTQPPNYYSDPSVYYCFLSMELPELQSNWWCFSIVKCSYWSVSSALRLSPELPSALWHSRHHSFVNWKVSTQQTKLLTT